MSINKIDGGSGWYGTSILSANKNEKVSNNSSSDDIPGKLIKAWEGWKNRFLLDNGLVKDPRMNAALSEASSYGMKIGLSLSVKENDQGSFDKMLDAAEKYLKRINGLYSWKVSLSGDGVGAESASDADIEIAYCLIMADKLVKSGKWKNTGRNYSQAATRLVNAIWEKEISKGEKYLILPTDNSWCLRDDGTVFNPSYFMPHQLKTIAEYDKTHNWKKVIDDGYELMNVILNAGLKTKDNNPIPDWAIVNIGGGKFNVRDYEATPDSEHDACRVMLQIGTDAIMSGDQRAKDFLEALLIKAKVGDFGTVKIGGYNNELAIALYGVAVKGAGDPGNVLARYKSQFLTTFNNDYFGYSTGDANDYYKQSLVLLSAIVLYDIK